MNLLLDTCTFLWLTGAPENLSPKALEVVKQSKNRLFLSAVSAWEIAIKYGKAQLTLSNPPRIFIPEKCAQQNIEYLPLDMLMALRTNELPAIHKDPFDRILICQALENDLTIITSDVEIQAYPVKTLW